MDLIQASILGLVQGLTEYLPVSSSAHLVLVPKLLGWNLDPKQAFIFDVLVQMGTLLGVIVYFFKDLCAIAKTMWLDLISGKPLQDPEARLGWFVGVATIPAAVFGLLLKSRIEVYFESIRAVYTFLIGTAIILVLAECLGKPRKTEIKFLDAIAIGFAQVVALLPGISRSGSTISMGVLMGVSKPDAARFSFLMSIPIMVGAGLIGVKDLLGEPVVVEQMLYPLLLGTSIAAVSGYLVIHWFLGFLKTQSLLWFAGYCALIGGLGLLFG